MPPRDGVGVQVSAVLGERVVLREVDRRTGALLRRLGILEVGKSGRRLVRVEPVRDAPRSVRGLFGGGGDDGVLECRRPGLGNFRQLRGAELLRPVALLERDAPFG